MKFTRTCIALAFAAIILTAGAIMTQSTTAATAGPTSQPKQSGIDSANKLFEAGKFADARKLYSKIVAQNPKDYSATLQLGRIGLLSNRLDDAQKWLEKAITLEPDNADAKVMLAEVFYRRDDFQKAAAALNGVDVSNNKMIREQYPLNVANLESFKGQTPYELQGNGTSTHVKFVKTDPLPIVNVRINGGKEVTFFIDTGGSVVTLDTEFAKELGVPQFGSMQGTFSGGQHAEVGLGRVDSVTLGDWTVKNVPTAMLPLRQLSEGFGVKQLDGIIGTTLFYHFLTTMDYPHGELVLRRKDAQNLQQFKKSPGKRVVVPIWMAGDHFMVGWGRVESLSPSLLFVDTGLTGAGVKLAESVIKEAGIKLEEDKATEGAGGGGTLKIVPYTVHHLSLGDIKEENVQGVYDGPFPFENTFGFRLAGMVGHEFFKPYAVTFDFQNMQIFLQR